MADIKKVAELLLCVASVMKEEMGEEIKENKSTPKQYGMSLKRRKKKK